MINVTMTESGKKLSLRVEGHAEYAEHGKDIVCASASILAYTVAQHIKDMYGSGKLTEEPTLELRSGEADISCHATEELTIVFSAICTGYKVLKFNYPQYVELNINGEAYMP